MRRNMTDNMGRKVIGNKAMDCLKCFPFCLSNNMRRTIVQMNCYREQTGNFYFNNRSEKCLS